MSAPLPPEPPAASGAAGAAGGAGGSWTSPRPLGTPAILGGYVLVGSCLLAIGALVARIVTAGDLGSGNALPDDLQKSDQLVDVTSILLGVAALGVLALVLRWGRAAQANRAALADPGLGWGGGDGLIRAWLVAVPAAVLVVLVTRLGLREADSVDTRQLYDGLEVLGSLALAVAAGLTIAVVDRVTGRQEERAARGGVTARPVRVRRRAAEADTGLRVLPADERSAAGSNPGRDTPSEPGT